MKVPVTVYAEMTPNPSTMKFVANKYLLITGESVEFASKKEAIGFSPLVEALFNFAFVKSVFITANFVTITKTNNVPWDFITMELREFVKDWISEGKDVLIQMPQVVTNENKEVNQSSDASNMDFEASELDDEIRSLLDQYVRPAVENDGGAIDFLGFKDGVVSVRMKGACAGCPSSTATLKGGIETLLKQYLPAVNSVLAVKS